MSDAKIPLCASCYNQILPYLAASLNKWDTEGKTHGIQKLTFMEYTCRMCYQVSKCHGCLCIDHSSLQDAVDAQRHSSPAGNAVQYEGL